MAIYIYKAIDNNGKTIKSQMSAADEQTLDDQLREKGQWLIDCKVETQLHYYQYSKIKQSDLIEFCDSMATMLAGGVSLVDSLETLSQHQDNQHYQQVLKDITQQVRSGKTLHGALSEHGKLFPKQVQNMIESGELSGTLNDAFKALADHLKWYEQLIRTIKQISIYPVFVLITVGLFVTLLFGYVVPKFAGLLHSLHVPLPWVTEAIINIGNFFQSHWWLVISTPILIVVLIKYLLARSKDTADKIDSLILSIPIIGNTIRMLSLSRFSSNLALLLNANTEVLKAFKLAKKTSGNSEIEKLINQVEIDISNGQNISNALAKVKLYPDTLQRMIIVGEQTGDLKRAFMGISQYYNEQVPVKTKSLLSIIEPVLMLFLIATTGVVAMAIFLPLIRLMGAIG